MERLTPLATAFLDAEDAEPTASLAIGSLSIFEEPTPAFEDFLRLIEGRLHLIPRYRQKLRVVPFSLAAPAWVDDPDFDVGWHVRNTALPAPGGPEEIGRLLSRVMTRRMDRNRPLWEYWFCEGLGDGRWALLAKLHHSVADGVSGTDLHRLILDPTRDTPTEVETDNHVPEPAMSTLSFTARAIRDSALSPALAARAAVGSLASPRRLGRRAAQTVHGTLSFARDARPVSASSLTGTLDGSRRYAWTTASLVDIGIVRHRLGASVNDVAMAAVTGGFRQLLLSRGEQPTATMVRSLVPVSTRAAGEESTPDNRVSLILPYLPVHLEEAVARLTAVQRALRVLRAAGEPVAGDSLTTVADYGFFAPVSVAIRVGLHLPQTLISTVTTNVPGPRSCLYALGCELQEILPYAPIADRVRISIAMFSYRDTLVFGVTGDYHSVPDIRTLTDGIASSMTELVEQGGDV